MGYREMCLKKRSGGYRLLEEPDPVLKFIQRQVMYRLKSLVKENLSFPTFITGGFGTFAGTQRTGGFHVDRDVILKLDIANFFGSVTAKMAYESLHYHLGLNKVEAACVASLATYKDHLPQGSPLSPIVANITALSMHSAFNRFTQEAGCAYAVYVDDMFFSGSAESDFGSQIIAIYKATRRRRKKDVTLEEFSAIAEEEGLPNPITILSNIAEGFGFTLKATKLRIMLRGQKQQIMDVCVAGCPTWASGGQHTRMPKAKRKEMFCAIHNLSRCMPRASIPHIRGLLCQAKRLNDQHYQTAKNKFDIALANWRRFLAVHPATLVIVATSQSEHSLSALSGRLFAADPPITPTLAVQQP